MNILVTGARGFIGRALVAQLLARGSLRGHPITRVLALDQTGEATPGTAPADPRLHPMQGDIADPAVLRQALANGGQDQGVQAVFHLASVPGGAAERDPALGERVNLQATRELFKLLGEQDREHSQAQTQTQARAQARPPLLVFASSVAVYGAALPALVDEATPPNPHLRYGAHKVAGEVLLRDASRRDGIDGRALRLPGVVARPRSAAGGSGLLSAYMSDILHALAAGEPYTCPVSAQAVSWWMSAACCVGNLIHAAELPTAHLNADRTWTLPVLRFTMAELVDALARRYGDDRRTLVQWAPNEALEAAFGRYPPLHTPQAEAVGFCNDGSIDALVRNALLGNALAPVAR